MSQFSGRQDSSGPLNGHKNKGVMAARRAIKRWQAKERQDINIRQGYTVVRRTESGVELARGIPAPLDEF